MTSGRGSARAGFLLVEALCTLALSALILVGLASVLASVMRASERITSHAGAQEITHHLHAALRRDLSGIARARWSGDPPRFIFEGTRDRMLFAVDVRAPEGWEATVLVALQSELVPGGSRLLRATAPFRPGALAASDVRLGPAEEVYRGSSIFQFGYAGPPAVGQPEIVTESWPSGAALPAAILLYESDAGGTPGAPVRIALEAEAELGCAGPEDAFCSLRPRRDGDAADGAEEEDPRSDP